MLELENVNAYYGDSHVLHGVSLRVGEGEAVCLLGRNGAGKTTTILTVMGYLQAAPGPHLVPRTRHRRAAALRAGAARHRLRTAGARHLSEPDRARKPHRVRTLGGQKPMDARCASSTMFPSSAARGGNLGFQLSGGEQQMLSIARALMLNPSLLLLDEPSEGLAPMIVREIVEHADRAQARGARDPVGRAEPAHRAGRRRPPPRHQQGHDLLHRQLGRAREQRVRAAKLSERVSRSHSAAPPLAECGKRPSRRRVSRPAVQRALRVSGANCA